MPSLRSSLCRLWSIYRAGVFTAFRHHTSHITHHTAFLWHIRTGSGWMLATPMSALAYLLDFFTNADVDYTFMSMDQQLHQRRHGEKVAKDCTFQTYLFSFELFLCLVHRCCLYEIHFYHRNAHTHTNPFFWFKIPATVQSVIERETFIVDFGLHWLFIVLYIILL